MSDSLFKNFGGHVEQDKTLAEVAAYKIGGPAKFFLTPKGPDDIAEALRVAEKSGLELFVLGSGTNLLVSDTGFAGAVLWLGPRMELTSELLTVVSEDAQTLLLKVPAAYSKAKLLDYAIHHRLGGLEFSAGIPGSLGGAVYMNAGTKWGSYGDIITEVEFISRARGVYTLKGDEIGFRYRGHGEGLLAGGVIVSAVTLRLRKHADRADLLKTVDEIYSYRGLRQPLELPNCGSVFKNPEGSEKGAGRLIEAAGLKGLSEGGAEISLKHANFILNTGTAKASDVHTLIKRVQDKIQKTNNLTLDPEVVFVGKFN